MKKNIKKNDISSIKKTFFSKKIYYILNTLIIIGLLTLPYYLFNGKLFIGGDDTRLFYIFPWEFAKNISFFSWYNFSSVGSYNPNQFSFPLLLSWSILEYIVPSKIVLDYLSFSLPLIIGFIYFQKLASVIIDKDQYKFQIFIGSLFYILSPILIQNQYSVFLYAVWLVGLLPVISFYFLLYVKTGKTSYLLKNILFCTWLSLALFSIPWWLGFVIPVLMGFVVTSILYTKANIILFIKRSLIFGLVLIFSQSFWLFPFSATFIQGGAASYGSQILSEKTANSFESTVNATATGTILFPLLNLFHRQIAFDYNWGLKSVYTNFYDKFLIINIIYLIIIFAAAFYAKRVLDKGLLKVYISIFCMHILSLFLFTVNIGPLKYIFLQSHFIPGIAMFRNFYDKFALGYALLYALLMVVSLIIITKKFPKYRHILFIAVLLTIFINFIPIKETIVRPVWGTKDILLNITIPDEYSNFMNTVHSSVPASSNILSLPYNIASYTFIKDENSKNIFAGTSPVKIFTGINDYSGNLSFSAADANLINKYISKRDYNSLENIFGKYNISYLIVSKNIPDDIKKTYLFHKKLINAQDDTFIKSLTQEKVLTSSSGNYELYKVKRDGSILKAENIKFYKVNQVEYHIHLNNVKEKTELQFLDSFNKGWNLYQADNDYSKCTIYYQYAFSKTECKYEQKLLSGNELKLLTSAPIYTDTHISMNGFGNKWTIDPSSLKNVERNADGSYNLDLILYFKPQLYFYFGILLSVITILTLSLITYRREFIKNEK